MAKIWIYKIKLTFFIQYKPFFWANIDSDNCTKPKYYKKANPPSKIRNTSSVIDETSTSLHEEKSAASSIVSTSFQSSYISCHWVEAESTRRQSTIVILFPSSVSARDCSTRVSKDSKSLLIHVTRPIALGNSSHLHRKWLQSKISDQIETFHPRRNGIEQFLKSYRTTYIDKVETTAKSLIPIQVQTHISTNTICGGLTVMVD